MDATQAMRLDSVRIMPGGVRWAGVVFAIVACLAGVVAAMRPEAAGWSGAVLLLGLGTTGGLFLFSAWPRERDSETARILEAAARAHVAWAITAADGAVLDCNGAYRQLSGTKAGKAPAPPELAFRSEAAAVGLYRLARSAGQGKPHQETIPLGAGAEMTAAVRPLKTGEAAWWFTPVLTRTTPSPQSEMVAAGVLENAPVGIAKLRAGRVAQCNKAFAVFFGQAPVNRALADLVDPEMREAVTQLLARGGTMDGAGIEIRSEKRSRMAELYVSTSDAAGDATAYLIDVSEQKALENRFAQSQKMQAIGQLAGGVAHDFNNLLTVIIGNAEMLLMRHAAGDPSFRDINDIRQNAIRAANLVKQLLAFSRQQTLQPHNIDLSITIAELAQLLRRLLGESVALKLEQEPGLWPVHADEGQFNNALINLAVNARDAMPNGGVVTIRSGNATFAEARPMGGGTMPAGDYVRIDLSDTGTGIAPEHLAKIFDPFFTTKPVGEGTGLGLATVYGIVKQSGGFIGVESEVGRGTTFRIYLPRHHGALDARPDSAPARDITGNETILLVEDEDAVRSIAARALKQRGYDVLEASGGEQALELVKSRPDDIHLVISDVVMPGMDGPTLVRAARRLQPDLKVIFMSGYAEEVFRRNDEKPENLHFLAKPFGLKQLAEKVKDVLSGAPPH